MYRLQAVIARSGVLDADRVVPLPQGLVLLPLPEAPFESVVVEWSSRGPVALVDAEFFGGVGSQRAQVWEQGRSVLIISHFVADEERFDRIVHLRDGRTEPR